MEKVFTKELDLDLFSTESKQILKDYICPLCEGVYKYPVLDSCGDIFCKECFNISISRSQLCPVRNIPYKDLKSFSTLEFINKILDKQKLFCKNKANGCEWFSTLCFYEKHLKFDCLKEIISCTNENCKVLFPREYNERHLEECEYRIVKCEDCGEQVSFHLLENHQKHCPFFKIPCSQSCNAYIERCGLDKHIKLSCPNTEVTCIYSSYGCCFQCPKRLLDDHYCKNTGIHNLLVLTFLESYQQKFVDKIFNLEENVRDLNEKLERFLSRSQETLINKKRIPEVNSNKHQIDLRDSDTEEEFPSLEKKTDKYDKIYQLKQEEGELRENVSPKASISKNTFNWDEDLTSSEIKISGNRIKCIFTKRNKHLFAFIDNTVNSRTIKWKISFHKVALWIAVGLCEKEKVIENDFIFSNYQRGFNHSCFVFSSNSYTWNANNPEENNKQTRIVTNFKENEEIELNYNHIRKELSFFDGSYNIKLTKVESFCSLVPVVIMINNGDEISAELLTKL